MARNMILTSLSYPSSAWSIRNFIGGKAFLSIFILENKIYDCRGITKRNAQRDPLEVPSNLNKVSIIEKIQP